LAAVAVKYPAFRDLGTEILSISVDSPDSHRKWQERELAHMLSGGVIFPMLADPEGQVGRLYGVYDEEERMDSRGRFLIDPEGRLQSMEVLAEAVGRNVTEILRQLRALQHQQSTGEYIPCGWQPGRPTLTREEKKNHENGNGCKKNKWETRHAF
jgi:peroxiredoxin (alkyl hydroperoxide reductase subunit C)